MANANETVADIANIMSGMIYPISRCPDLKMREYADRIEVAHKREVEELIGIINRECNKCSECSKFQHCLKSEYTTEDSRGCPRFVSKREAAKDAEIAKLRRHYQDMLKRIVQKDKGANDEK